jgi:hypothetical protein
LYSNLAEASLNTFAGFPHLIQVFVAFAFAKLALYMGDEKISRNPASFAICTPLVDFRELITRYAAYLNEARSYSQRPGADLALSK